MAGGVYASADFMALGQARNVKTFVGEELAFASRFAVIATEAMTGGDNTMAWDDEADWVLAHGTADGLGGHFGDAALGGDKISDFAIGHGFAEWDLASDFEDAAVEWREIEVNWRDKIGLPGFVEILIEPKEGLREDRMLRHGRRRREGVGVANKMEFKQGFVAGAQEDCAKR